MKKEYDIFISYRREGGKEYARNLTSELVSRGFHPFLDFDELKDGKFDKRITDAIESAPVFLFILSPGSLDRCVNEDDWVRQEILHAVKHNRHIIPVDIDKQFGGIPQGDDFPDDVRKAIGQHQFTQIQTETLYRVSVDEMVKNRIMPAIEEYRREREKAAGTHGAEIHIETDMDCHVQRFHRDMIVARVDEENVIHLPKGKHKLQFIAVENPQIKDSCEYRVEDISESDFIEVFLKDKAGIISVEAAELESLKQERDALQAKLGSSLSQLKSLTYSLKGKDEKLAICVSERDNLSKSIESLKVEIKKKTVEIDKLQKELSASNAKCDILTKELKSYTDKELLEQKARAEAARKEAELKAKVEAEKRKPKHEFTVGGVTFKMIRVEGGTFTMGATSEMDNPKDNEKPTHQVTLSSYHIGETQVTQALWKAVMGSNPSYFKGDNLPVEQVSWDDCQGFIRKLNSKTGKNFRLPTEAEWEFAARGGNKSNHAQYSGSSNINDVAWYDGNSGGKTHPVATKKANELGIYDMTGNVWEWCQDRKGSYSSNSQTNPVGPNSGSNRVFRGGSWRSNAGFCRSSFRNFNSPGNRSRIGLRLCLSE